ncbi:MULTISPECIES: hypothetical protein [unclassified Frankia]|uniref:hypothetical protein n=1 Tax=unclassified Frankia TaxID=2632575 RepID=UPI001EF6B7A4|nr:MULTISPECIES: hypothetical protein [unclassified Frankia]
MVSEPDDGPRMLSVVDALHAHLDRADRGQGRWFADPTGQAGQEEFACDMGESRYGCPWCDRIAWPDGNPVDGA